MILFFKIYLKVYTLFHSFTQNIYTKICIKKGLKLGKGVELIGKIDFGSEPYLIEIGNRTKITDGCKFINHDGAMYVIRNFPQYSDARSFGRIKIGDNCFIGNNCVILPNVSIGNNSILGAGSILNSSIPDNCVYAGVPAKFICSIEEYGKKSIKNNTFYPRILESNRKKLDAYISKNLPHNYKPAKKNV